MPHPEENPAPDQWDASKEVTEDTAREVHPWQRMDQKNAPRNFRPVPINADADAEVPTVETASPPTAPKGLSAPESATSSQGSDSPWFGQQTAEQTVEESPTPETPAQVSATKDNGSPKENETS